MIPLFLLLLFSPSEQAPALPSLGLLSGSDGYLVKKYINAITAYGPGLGVYTPYSYVDVSYDNIPFVGKIPIIGKDGTSSRLGVSPFYPPGGNPSNPFPPIYKARPLPLHVPEPQDVVAVPLDEEALHGEPLFPPELILPSEKAAEEAAAKKLLETSKPENPFADVVEPTGEQNLEDTVQWPAMSTSEVEGDSIDKKNMVQGRF
uniref:COesterase domain-containing protein n=1 Tax=Caenorhabditis tropicalis TaxID=1561998 RepID=A0A1I7TA57_9PELO